MGLDNVADAEGVYVIVEATCELVLLARKQTGKENSGCQESYGSSCYLATDLAQCIGVHWVNVIVLFKWE